MGRSAKESLSLRPPKVPSEGLSVLLLEVDVAFLRQPGMRPEGNDGPEDLTFLDLALEKNVQTGLMRLLSFRGNNHNAPFLLGGLGGCLKSAALEFLVPGCSSVSFYWLLLPLDRVYYQSKAASQSTHLFPHSLVILLVPLVHLLHQLRMIYLRPLDA